MQTKSVHYMHDFMSSHMRNAYKLQIQKQLHIICGTPNILYHMYINIQGTFVTFIQIFNVGIEEKNYVIFSVRLRFELIL